MQEFFELSPFGPFSSTYMYYSEYPVEVTDIWEKVRRDIRPEASGIPKNSKIGITLYSVLVDMVLDTMAEEKMIARTNENSSGFRPISNLPLRIIDVPVKDQIKIALKQSEHINRLVENSGDKGAKCCYLTFESIPESQADKIYGAIAEGLQYAMNQKPEIGSSKERLVNFNLSFLSHKS